MKTVNLIQGTPEWLAWRDGGIGASEAPVIMGFSAYQTAYNLFAVRTGRLPKQDISNNPNVKRGNRNEEAVRSLVEDETGLTLLPCCGESDDNPIIRASFDGIDDHNRPHELKAPSEKIWDEVCEKGLESPTVRMYAVQLQHQIGVCGGKEGFLHFGFKGKLKSFPITRKQSFIDKMFARELFFWNALQTGKGIDPDPDKDVFIPEDAATVKLWDASQAEVLTLDAEIKALTEKVNAAKARKAEIVEQLSASMGQFHVGQRDRLRLALFEREGAMNWDQVWKEAIVLHPELEDKIQLSDFRKSPTPQSRLTLLKKEETA